MTGFRAQSTTSSLPLTSLERPLSSLTSIQNTAVNAPLSIPSLRPVADRGLPAAVRHIDGEITPDHGTSEEVPESSRVELPTQCMHFSASSLGTTGCGLLIAGDRRRCEASPNLSWSGNVHHCALCRMYGSCWFYSWQRSGHYNCIRYCIVHQPPRSQHLSAFGSGCSRVQACIIHAPGHAVVADDIVAPCVCPSRAVTFPARLSGEGR